MNWKALLEPTKEIAKRAGEIITESTERKIHIKGDQDFVTETDLAVNDFLMEELEKLFPESGILTEESDDHTLSDREFVWIIDPIDGTTNYIFDLQLSSVSIGLLNKGEVVLGVVYNPYTNEMFYATKGEGAFLNDQKITVNDSETIKDSVILCETNPYGDRSSGVTRDAIHKVFQECIDYRVLGSAALDICYIACGRGSAFFCEGINPWDYAGGNIILSEAGGKVSRWDGSDISYQGFQTYACSNKKVQDELLSYLPDKK